MEQFIVKKEDMLINSLRENLTKYSKNNIKTFLSKEMVVVNNSVQTRYDYLVKKGDKISIRETKIRVPKLRKDINILYEDDDIIVINKPAGLLTIATSKEKEYTLYHFVMEYLKSKNKNNKVFVIHRLDRETSGIVMFAKNISSKNLFQKSWNDNIINRCYYAVVEGSMKQKEGILKSYLVENDKSYMVYSTPNKKEGKLAVTLYRVVKENKGYSLLDINIKTGRKNQIRVQLKDNGNIIVGDKKYGSESSPLNRMALHQYKLELIDPRNKMTIKFKTEMPTVFNKLIK